MTMSTLEIIPLVQAELRKGRTTAQAKDALIATGHTPQEVDDALHAVAENAFDRVFFGERKSTTENTAAALDRAHTPSPFTTLDLSSSKRLVHVGMAALLLVVFITIGIVYWNQSAPSRLLSAIQSAQQDIHSYESEFRLTNASGTDLMSGVMDLHFDKAVFGGETAIPNIGVIKSVMSSGHYFGKVTITDPTLQSLLKLPNVWIDYDLKDPNTPGGALYLQAAYWTSPASLVRTDCSAPAEQTLEEIPVLYMKCPLVGTEAGAGGSYELWMNSSTYAPVQIKVNTSGQTLTQRISKVNYAPEINVPTDALTIAAWKEKQFFDSLPKEPITTVIIYRGKGVSLKEEATAVQAIRSYYGVNTVTFPEDIGTLPKQFPVYNTERKQYDADVIWSLIGNQKQSTSTRFVYLLPVDMYSLISPERTAVTSRALPEINTVLVSLSPLKKDAPATGSTTETLINERITKTVVRALGVSAGIAYSTDADQKECIMYQATSTQGLDEVGTSTCPMTERAIKHVFNFEPAAQAPSSTPPTEQ